MKINLKIFKNKDFKNKIPLIKKYKRKNKINNFKEEKGNLTFR
jgi:hypothetical protein